jgi:hypothetical protein
MTVRTTARAIAMLGASALLFAACGGSNTGAPASGAASAAPATEAPAATSNPAPTDAGFSFALPSFIGDQELEAMLPKEIGGEALTVVSMTGDEFLGDGSISPEISDALDALGKTTSDLSVAFGGTSTVQVVAFRVKGAPADALFDAFKTAQTDEYTSATVSLGGKQVTKITPTDGDVAYIYTKDDTMFVVGGADATDAVLNEAFSKLP